MAYTRPRVNVKERGFSLLEALVALALMGLIIAAIAIVSGQWLPVWNRPAQAARRSEQIAMAFDRIADDLAAAQWVSVASSAYFFRGITTEVIFVRSALGPNSAAGLEFIRLIEIVDKNGAALVRERAPFTPVREGAIERVVFTNPVVLLRSPLRLSFSYGGSDGRWNDRWVDLGVLPSMVRFTIRDDQKGDLLTAATRILANAPAPRPEMMEEGQAGPKP